MIPKRHKTLDPSRLLAIRNRRAANARPTKDYARKRRWLYGPRPDMAVLAHTRSEAIGWFKRELGVDRIETADVTGELV